MEPDDPKTPRAPIVDGQRTFDTAEGHEVGADDGEPDGPAVGTGLLRTEALVTAAAPRDDGRVTARAEAFAEIATLCHGPLSKYLSNEEDFGEACGVITKGLGLANFWRNSRDQWKVAAADYREALANPGVTVGGFTPSIVDMAKIFEARDNLQNASLVRVLGVSMGGTNNKIGTGTVKGGKVYLDSFQSDSLEQVDKDVEAGKDYTEDEFWETLFPKESAVKYLKEMQSPDDPTKDKNGNPLFLALTFGTPINMIPGQVDGHFSHHSTKIRCDALAPFDTKQRDEEKASGRVPERPTIATSLVNYLKRQGINFPKENVAVTPNDTVSCVVAYGMNTKISGTGVNAGTRTPTVNSECCDASAFGTSYVEQEAGLDNMFEPLVCGEHMGKAFKVAVEKLFGLEAKDPSSSENSLVARLKTIDYKDMAAVVFNLAAPAEERNIKTLLPLSLTNREYQILQYVARAFISRAANLTAQMGLVFEDVHGCPMTFATEGSVFARNPWYVKMINLEYKSYGGQAEALLVSKPLPVAEVPTGKEGLVDASAIGGFVYAACVNATRQKAA